MVLLCMHASLLLWLNYRSQIVYSLPTIKDILLVSSALLVCGPVLSVALCHICVYCLSEANRSVHTSSHLGVLLVGSKQVNTYQ